MVTREQSIGKSERYAAVAQLVAEDRYLKPRKFDQTGRFAGSSALTFRLSNHRQIDECGHGWALDAN